MAVALQDYVAPDCRFLTIYRGQVVYVFSKLKGRGRLFWGGSVSLQRVIMGRVWGLFGFVKPCFPYEGKIWGEGKTRFGGRKDILLLIAFFFFSLEITEKLSAKALFHTRDTTVNKGVEAGNQQAIKSGSKHDIVRISCSGNILSMSKWHLS